MAAAMWVLGTELRSSAGDLNHRVSSPVFNYTLFSAGVGVHVCASSHCIHGRPGDNLWESALFFQHVGPGNQAQGQESLPAQPSPAPFFFLLRLGLMQPRLVLN